MANSDNNMEVFQRGAVDLISEYDLKKKLAQKRPLRIKYGADPSAPDLHLGHTVPLRKLKELQDLGHQIIFIIGDFTARVGDPSQQSETRRLFSASQVKENAKTYENQVFQILDRLKTEVHYNSEWFSEFKPDDFLSLTSKYTVARILERDDFQKRFKEKKPITILEFIYPLLQGYDSVMVRADVEVGGTDQKFNLLVGRELQRDAEQEPQVVMTLPIIAGVDGKIKMSKSVGNAIGIQDEPNDMFGKIMSIPDDLMLRYWNYLAGLTAEEFKKIEKEIQSKKVHPRESKAQLGERIVSLYYGVEKGKQAREEFDQVFQKKERPTEVPKKTVNQKEWNIVELLVAIKLCPSKNEARRLVTQGGVKVDEKTIDDPMANIQLSKAVLVKCGKRKFLEVEFEQ